MNNLSPDYFLSPDPNRPRLIIRLRSGHEDPAIWQRLFEQLKKNREICDEVWFATGTAFPKLDEHRRKAELLAAHAAELRSIGIIPSLQIQATLGHSDRTFADNSLDGKTWGSYVGCNGEVTRSCNCPNQPGFLEYMAQISRLYAQWQPGSLWIDDDLRLDGHWPALDPFGCYCDDCIAAFSAAVGKNFSREELVQQCKNDPELDALWKKSAIASITRLTEVIVSNVIKISPATRFGFQHCNREERIDILQTMKKISKTKPASRPGGGVDSDHDPYFLIDKACLCSLQTYTQPGYETIGQLCPEIESYPRTFCCKTAHGLRLETILYLALGGGDSMSYFIMDPICETPEWYGNNLLTPLAADAPVFRDFIRRNENTIPSGVGRKEQHCYTFRIQDLGFPLLGVPQSGYSPGAKCIQLTAFAVREMDDRELETVLKQNIILDGAAAEAVIARNFGKYLENITVSRLNECLYDFCTDDPLNSGFEGAKNFPFSEERFVCSIPSAVNARILSRYLARGENHGDATVIFERPDGTRGAIIGYDGFHTQYIPSSRIMMINHIADWVSGGTLPAMPLDPNQCLIVPRITREGTLRTVTILNTTIGVHAPFKLRLRNIPAGAGIFWCAPQKSPIKLEAVTDNGNADVTIPEIAAWDIGYLAFD